LSDFSFDHITNLIETLWSNSGANAELIQHMRQAVFSEGADPSQSKAARLTLLPGYCCQAAGGEPARANSLAAAWFLFYCAADLMDSVEDSDTPAAWWANLGPALALNVASGLFFSASAALHQIHGQTSPEIAIAISNDFHHNLMSMANGQHMDLTHHSLSLENFWQLAAAKSGAFFDLACRAGARLANVPSPIVEQYGIYGHHLGILVQILDDLDDIQRLPQATDAADWKKAYTSLPVIYSLEVSSPEHRMQLQANWQAAAGDPNAATAALSWLEESGAAIYLGAEIENHRHQAMAALAAAQAVSPAGNILRGIVQQLGQIPNN
jgi:geranylgeranyl diphosphate synthase, type I